MVIIQSNPFNESRISTVIVAVITSNTRLSTAPGNILLGPNESGLPKESVINVSQVITIDKSFLTERISALSAPLASRMDEGLRLVIGL